MEHLIENEELYRAWIGTKNQDVYIEKMKKGGFNFSACLIWDLTLIFRKMFLEVILTLLIYFVMGIILSFSNIPENISNLLFFLSRVGMGFLYYPLYRNFIKRKIEKYKKKGLTYEEQLKVAEKYGGDKFSLAAILMIIVEVIFIFALYYITILVIGVGTVLTMNTNKVVSSNDYNTNTLNNFIVNDIEDNSEIYDNVENEIESDDIFSIDSTEDVNNDLTKNDLSKLDIDSQSLYYDPSVWKEVTYSNYKGLKYKDEENVILYAGNISEGANIENFKNDDYKYEWENKMKSESGLDDSAYVIWDDINSNWILCKIISPTYDDEYNIVSYKNCYFYVSSDKCYAFFVIENMPDYEFEDTVEIVMNTIIDN